MLDKLIEFFLNLIEDLLPIFFVKEYNRGVMFRMGKYRRVVSPGPVWKIPFLDKIESTCVVTTTLSIPTQSITTADGKQVVVKSMVKFKVADVKAFYLNVTGTVDAISDTTQSIIKEQIASKTWIECTDKELDNTITKKVRTQVKNWGIDVDKVTLTDMGIIRSLRLFNETSTKD